MRRVNTVGSVQSIGLHVSSLNRSNRLLAVGVMAQADAALLQKAFSLLKKQGRSIYIDDDDREKKTFKPLPFSADLPLAFVFLSVSFSLRNVVEAKNILFRALVRWFFKKLSV